MDQKPDLSPLAGLPSEAAMRFIVWTGTLPDGSWLKLIRHWRDRAERTGDATFPPTPAECAEALGMTPEEVRAGIDRASTEDKAWFGGMRASGSAPESWH